MVILYRLSGMFSFEYTCAVLAEELFAAQRSRVLAKNPIFRLQLAIRVATLPGTSRSS